MTKHITLLAFFCLFFQFNATARHIIGGDFTYECLGEQSPGVMRYKFKLTVFRDCQSGGAQFDQRAYIGVHTGNLQGSILSDTINAPGMTVIDVPADTPGCVNQFPSVCVESKTYEFFRNLPVINESYFITWQRCCRNETISNLINPGEIGATYYIEISPLAQLNCNNSPVFNNFPRIVICNNIPLMEDQSATDADGDLLVYSFCSPLVGGANAGGGGGTGCNSVTPRPSCGPPFTNAPMVVPTYTPTAPMGGMPIISINSITGLVTGTPNKLGQYVVAICVQEFRNGQPIGTMRREFQFNIADCGADIVAAMSADTLIGQQVYMIKSCDEKTLEIKNQSLLGSPPADILWKFDLNNGTTYTTTTKDATITFPDYGRYRGVLILNPMDLCNDSAEVFIDIVPGIEANFSIDYDTCVAGPVRFLDQSTSLSGTKSIGWSFEGGKGTSTDNDPQYQYSDPGTQLVSLTVVDNDGCRDQIDSTIEWRPVPPVLIIQPNRFIECSPAEIIFTNLSNPIDSTYFVAWDYGDGLRDTGIISPTHQYLTSGRYNVVLKITSPIGCTVVDTFIQLIEIVDPPVADFSFDTTLPLNQFNRAVTFTDLSTNTEHVGWTFEPYITSTQRNPTYTFSDTGFQKVLLVATHPQGCKDTITKWLDIVPFTNFTMPNAFTPNGDSNNDVFVGNGVTEYMKAYQFQIWSRWGEMVFSSTDVKDGWNGSVQNAGALCQDGTYHYTVQFVDARGKESRYQGVVHLMR
jgi:gliding motility-associated-like protein